MIKIKIDVDSLRESKSKLGSHIFSGIYFSIDDFYFPEKGWDDYSAIILNWWMESAANSTKGMDVSLRFMDGPFYLQIHPEEAEACISFFDSREKDKSIYSIRVERFALFKEIANSANLLIRYAMSKNISHEEIISLQERLSEFQNLLKRLKPS